MVVVMRMRRPQSLIAVAAVLVLGLPAVARAGDSPIFVVGGWGIGEIDGEIMLYMGTGRYMETPIPAPPHGPRWDVVYRAFPVVVVVLGAGAVAAWRSRRLRPSRL